MTTEQRVEVTNVAETDTNGESMEHSNGLIGRGIGSCWSAMFKNIIHDVCIIQGVLIKTRFSDFRLYGPNETYLHLIIDFNTPKY